MCVKTVIDASAFRHFSERTKRSAGYQIQNWVVKGNGVIVFSFGNNKYAEELKKNGKAVRLLDDFTQRGRTEQISDESITAALDTIPQRPIRKSNDPHVLALAKAGKATVLFSCDDELCIDFVNPIVLCKVGRTTRANVPKLEKHKPADITGSNDRSRFLSRRRCRAKQK